MQFLTWGINKPDILEERAKINEPHWAFWDNYEGRLIARGPVLDPSDGKTPLGSIHIAELDSFDDAKVMAYDEPYAAAGLFRKLILTRFQSALDKTQFEIEQRPDKMGFCVYCTAATGAADKMPDLQQAHEQYCADHADLFACRGALLTDDGTWNGAAFFIEVDDQAAAEKFLAEEPLNAAGLYATTEIVRWRRGGRANAPKS